MKRASVYILFIISALSIIFIVVLHLPFMAEFPFMAKLKPENIKEYDLPILLLSLIGLYLAVDDISTSNEINTRLNEIEGLVLGSKSEGSSKLNELTDRINQVSEQVLRSKGGECFTNFAGLWNRITHLACQADYEILVIVSNDEFVPADGWYDGLTKRLPEVYNYTRAHVRYDLVIHTAKEDTDEDYKATMLFWTKWKESLPQYARDHVQIAFRKTSPLGLTAVIIDQKHVCICVVSKGKGHTDTGLVFENSGELGARMATWFNLQFAGDLQARHH